jgi:hypothetical protein
MKKPKVIKAWAVYLPHFHVTASVLTLNQLQRPCKSIWNTKTDALAHAKKYENDQPAKVVPVEIRILPSRKSAKPRRAPKA